MDRLVLKAMAVDSPKAQISGAKARVLANALRTTRSTLEFTRTLRAYLLGSAVMKIYRGFPARLHHRVPHWVEPGAVFHVRIRLEREKDQKPLTAPALGRAILDSAKFYEANLQWHIALFLLMPDHLHAVLSFPRDKSMSEVIRDWKRFHKRVNHVIWQEGYFDHRLRTDERGTQLSAKLDYIRQNPVAAGLCMRAEDWPWVFNGFEGPGGSSCPQNDGK